MVSQQPLWKGDGAPPFEKVDFSCNQDHVLVDDGTTKIYLRPTVGHTPGHCSLMVESGGEKAIVTGASLETLLDFEHLRTLAVGGVAIPSSFDIYIYI